MDKEMIFDKELNYIETLYLTCNLEDFIKVHKETHNLISTSLKYGVHKFSYFYPDGVFNASIDGYEAYKFMLDNLYETHLVNLENLGESAGYNWYKSDKYQIGIGDYSICKSSKNSNCIIQYSQKYMFYIKDDISKIEFVLGGDPSMYKIRRIDITKIAQHSNSYLAGYGYISGYRSLSNYHGTVYLGSRKSGNVFRIYNKSKELIDNKDFNKMDLLGNYFGSIENLYTYELELRRKYLKEICGIDRFSDLDKVFELHADIVGRIRFYKLTDHNNSLLATNNRKLIEAERLTKYQKFDRIKKEKYDVSEDFLIKRCISFIDKYLEDKEIKKDDSSYISIISKILEKRADVNGMKVEISLVSTDESDSRYQFKKDLENRSQNQSNSLEKEAEKAFKFAETDSEKNKKTFLLKKERNLTNLSLFDEKA